MATDLYPSSNNSSGLFNDQTLGALVTGGNFDLRQELRNILYGWNGESGKGHTIVLRDMNKSRLCPCMLEEDGERTGSPDPKCSICHGEKYIFVDREAFAYRALAVPSPGLPDLGAHGDPGFVTVDSYYYYFEYDTEIVRSDKLIEVNLDLEGNLPANGYTREDYGHRFNIVELIKFRADNRGRVEFILAIAKRDTK